MYAIRSYYEFGVRLLDGAGHGGGHLADRRRGFDDPDPFPRDDLGPGIGKFDEHHIAEEGTGNLGESHPHPPPLCILRPHVGAGESAVVRELQDRTGAACRIAASSVLWRSIAMVIGPTPPGTGVIFPARNNFV